MRKSLRACFVALAIGASSLLAACDALPTLDIASQVNLNTEPGIIAGYGIVVNAENAYKAFPLCKTGTAPSITNICAKRSVIVTLQGLDRRVNAALNAMNSFVKTNPNVSPSGYISAAKDALLAVQTVLNTQATQANGAL